jgi:hypothetical protein
MKKEGKKEIKILDKGIDVHSMDGPSWPCCWVFFIPM